MPPAAAPFSPPTNQPPFPAPPAGKGKRKAGAEDAEGGGKRARVEADEEDNVVDLLDDSD